MKVIVGGQYYSTLDASTVSITKSVSDPVPTCQLTLTDQNSSINIPKPSEIIVLDEQVIPNPTVNMLLNPSLNPYTTSWTVQSQPAGITLSQIVGGGVSIAMNNAIIGTSYPLLQATTPGSIIPGQQYVLSFTAQGISPVNIGFSMQIGWATQSGGSAGTANFVGTVPISTTLTRYSIVVTAPASTSTTPVSFAQIALGIQRTSSTNSGTITITQVQLEPLWFPTLSYPTPFCGPSQTNCVQLPNGQWIRQYRKFGGFVNDVQPGNYRGNTRDYVINAVGYAWLLSTIYVPDSFTSKTDAQIMTSLLSTYLVNTPPNGTSNAMCTTTNIISSGITLSNFGSNWDDLRTNFNNLASQSTFYWTISDYWDAIYAPYGYFSMMIELVLDSSSNPDFVTTFPGYAVSAEEDFTQPGSTILVIGSGTNVAKVVDPSQSANIGMISGYFLPTGTAWMRKVNDSSLGSVADCTQRGMAELLQYDDERDILNVTTNEELFAGYGVRVMDAQDGYSGTVLLVQQVTATWIGTNETLTDGWEYAATLGAVNRDATNILSRLARNTNANTSAPAISSTTLAVLENVAIADTIDGGSLYAEAVLSDSPIAYYRLGEPAGFGITTAYDWSGQTNNGTYGGAFTLSQPGAIYNDANTAVLFDGSTGKIDLAAGLSTTGFGALTFEAWIKLSNTSFGGNVRIFSNDHTAIDNQGCELVIHASSLSLNMAVGNGTTHTSLTGASGFVAGQWYHVVGTWAAGGQTFLYINGVQMTSGSVPAGTIAAATNSIAIGYSPASSSGTFFPGILDECAVYSTQLSLARIQAHYNVGTMGRA